MFICKLTWLQRRMLVDCGIGLLKLCCIIGGWSIFSSQRSCGSAPSCFSGARGEETKDLWPLEWFEACVDGCTDVRG